MTKKVNKFVSLIITISCLMLCGFLFGTRDTPLPNMPEGNTETEQSIVVRFDSTAEQFLKETSSDVRFMAYKTSDGQHIDRLMTPISDFAAKKITLLDRELGFVADNIHKLTINFERKTHIWSTIYFYPYEPSKWGSEEEVRRHIDDWVKQAEDAGWKGCSAEQLWNPYMLPTPESKLDKKVYMSWTAQNHRITLMVIRANPEFYKWVKDHPKYNLEIRMINESKRSC